MRCFHESRLRDGAVLGGDERANRFVTRVGVHFSHDRDLFHPLILGKDVFHLLRIHVLASGLDQILLAVDEVKVAVGILPAQVSRVQPVPRVQGRVGLGLGVVYATQVRKLPADRRVSAWDALPLAIVLPVSYAFMTLLAILTLDSAKWETRGHAVPDEADDAVGAADPVVVAEPVMVAEPISIAAAVSARALARQAMTHAAPHAVSQAVPLPHELPILRRTRRDIRRRLVESRRFTASESWPALTAATQGDRRK